MTTQRHYDRRLHVHVHELTLSERLRLFFSGVEILRSGNGLSYFSRAEIERTHTPEAQGRMAAIHEDGPLGGHLLEDPERIEAYRQVRASGSIEDSPQGLKRLETKLSLGLSAR